MLELDFLLVLESLELDPGLELGETKPELAPSVELEPTPEE